MAHRRSSDSEKAFYRRIGARLRERRIALGITQDQMGRDLGVTYQQFHKYEHGRNRIPIPKLIAAASRLGVSLAYVLEASSAALPPATARARMSLEMARSFAALPQKHQDIVAAIVRRLAE